MDDLNLSNLVGSTINTLNSFKDQQDINYNTPNELNMNINGLYSANSINYLFSPMVDQAIDKIMDIFLSGSYTTVLDKVKALTKTFETMGIGRGVFQGPIGSSILNTVEKSIKKIDLNKTTSKIKKGLTLLLHKKKMTKELKKEGKKIIDPVAKEKYDQAVAAFTSMMKMIYGIYRNRKYINDKVVNGLNNIVYEDNDETGIIKIEC